MPFSLILHVRAAYPAPNLAPNPLISFSIQYDLYVKEREREACRKNDVGNRNRIFRSSDSIALVSRLSAPRTLTSVTQVAPEGVQRPPRRCTLGPSADAPRH